MGMVPFVLYLNSNMYLYSKILLYFPIELNILQSIYSITWSETLIQSRQGNDIESCHEAALLRQHRCFETFHCSHLEPFELHIRKGKL